MNTEDEIFDEEISEGLELKEENITDDSDEKIDVKKVESTLKIEGEEDSLVQLEKAKQNGDLEKDVEISKDESDKFADELYSEFSSFLEEKIEITSDSADKSVIPTGIDILDAHLGGGFAVGALSVIVGNPGSGKSMLAMQVIANGQRLYGKKGLISAFLDSETATTTKRLANLGVVNPMLKPYTDITVEKVFKTLEAMCLFKLNKKLVSVPSIVVWDSIANTLSQKEMEAEDPNSVIGYKQKLLSLLIPKYVSKCGSFNVCLIAVNQLRDNVNIGMFAPPPDLKFMGTNKTIPGGNSLRFNAFQLIDMKVKSPTNEEKVGFKGFISKVKIIKNKLFVPNVELEIVGDFIRGFNNFYTNYQFLVDNKRLKTGAWNYLVDLPDKKFRTKDANSIYNDDQTFKNAFDKAVKDTIQTEIIDKYSV